MHLVGLSHSKWHYPLPSFLEKLYCSRWFQTSRRFRLSAKKDIAHLCNVSIKLSEWRLVVNFSVIWLAVFSLGYVIAVCGSFSIPHFIESLSCGHFIWDLFGFNYKVIHLAECEQDLWHPKCCELCSLAPAGADLWNELRISFWFTHENAHLRNGANFSSFGCWSIVMSERDTQAKLHTPHNDLTILILFNNILFDSTLNIFL